MSELLHNGKPYDLKPDWVTIRADMIGMEVFEFFSQYGQPKSGKVRVLARNREEAREVFEDWEAAEEEAEWEC